MNTTTQTTLNTLSATLEGLALSLAAEGFAASHPLALAVQQAQAQQTALKLELAGFAQRVADDVGTVAKAVQEAYQCDTHSALPGLAVKLLHVGARVDGLNMAAGGVARVGGLSDWLKAADAPFLVQMVAGAGAGAGQQIGGAA